MSKIITILSFRYCRSLHIYCIYRIIAKHVISCDITQTYSTPTGSSTNIIFKQKHGEQSDDYRTPTKQLSKENNYRKKTIIEFTKYIGSQKRRVTRCDKLLTYSPHITPISKGQWPKVQFPYKESLERANITLAVCHWKRTRWKLNDVGWARKLLDNRNNNW